jgi:hypothetical protein
MTPITEIDEANFETFHSQFWADNAGVLGNLGDLFSNHVSHFARI